MSHPDAGIDALRELSAEFAAFRVERGGVSEADTRVKVIDRILKDVLQWPEDALSREDRVHSGFVDYILSAQNRQYVAVEAKREGIAFILPTTLGSHRHLKLDGALTTDTAIKDAVHQVRRYCDDQGIRYAIVTNGYSWIVFRAIREDLPWRSGHARVFESHDSIEEHFSSFWNLLSYESISLGSLDAEFGAPNTQPRGLYRVTERLFNADLPLQRNPLHAQLHPLITRIFENIADQDQVEILRACYVHSQSLRIVAEDLNLIITDAIPKFLRDQGATPVMQSETDAGFFGIALAQAMPTRHGQLFLLLGGIGAGKTTFIRRYQRTVGADLLNANAIWFHVDFLRAPTDLREMEGFVWRTVIEQLRTRYVSPYLETRRNIKRAFATNINAIEHTGLRGLRPGTDAYENALTPFLIKWQDDLPHYVPKLLEVGRRDRAVEVVIFIDNVDQLSPLYQAQIFLLSQRVTRSVGCITVVTLREESYYTANTQRTLTAYTSRKFHIASPRFRRLIESRIGFALRSLEDDETRSSITPEGIKFDASSIASLLKIVGSSIFQKNRNIALFIESLCFGNMRMALEMFTTFLVSGATDVGKMLGIYRREGAYFVAFHEFVKSIMLGDRKYYKESESPVMNLYDCGAERHSSHFTALRILAFLLSRRGESSREGRGYCEVAKVISFFEDVFDNREDIVRTLERLVYRQLIEANTRSTDSIVGASHVRVTSGGWYYSKFLAGLFAYLDLVLQDTPIDDPRIEEDLRDSVFRVDNLADREGDKIIRMAERFSRVSRFLEYLKEQEDREHRECSVERLGGVIGRRFVPDLLGEFGQERDWIERRLLENREKLPEDFSVTTLGSPVSEVPGNPFLFEIEGDE